MPTLYGTSLQLRTPSNIRTNAALVLGNGSIGLSSMLWGGGEGTNINWRPGIEFYPNGWKGTQLNPTIDGASPCVGTIRMWDHFGTLAGPSFPYMHFMSHGSIRLEPNFGVGTYHGLCELVLGNEDGNPRIVVNYNHKSFTNSGDLGYSLPLVFWSKVGHDGLSCMPAIQGIAAPLERTPVISHGGRYLGELAFQARMPTADTDWPTLGRVYPEDTVEVGRMMVRNASGNLENTLSAPPICRPEAR